MRKRSLRRIVFFSLPGLLLVLFHQPLLTHLAASLVVSDPLDQADAIVVLSGDETARCPKAAELFRQGWAPKIVLTKSYYPHEALALRRYGIEELESHDKCRAILLFLHVPAQAIAVVDGYNESTADEAYRLRQFLQEHGMERAIVVTSSFHTRRSRLLLRRVLRGTGVEVSVQAAPANFLFEPQGWWTRRRDTTTLLWEYQKLVFYALRYW
ncbi:MAG: YdcF family protein [Candidatus Binatia bacterium]|nr:YdcF family protein [Candidatus Binatia bacterium]